MANPNQDARNRQGRYVRTPETAARDAQAAELLADGYSYRQIADELGYQSHTAAIQACRRAVRDIVHGSGEKLIAVHVDRLEYLFGKALEIAETDHVVVSHGKIIKDDEGNPLKDSAPTLAAIREARETLASFRKLTGLDAPSRVSVEAEQLGREIGRLLDASLGPEDSGDDPDA